MDFRAQAKRYIISGLSVLAAVLMLSATALAASSAVVPCDQVGRDLKSLEVPVEALTVDAVDHVPTDHNAVDPAAIDEESAVTDSVAPILYLTPRMTNILRDMFGAAPEDLPPETPGQPSSSPLADSDQQSDPIEPADAGNEASDLPRYQQHCDR